MEYAGKQQNTTKVSSQKAQSFFGKKTEPAFFAPLRIQPKLTIGPVDDPYEREADAVADKVMRMSDAEISHGKSSVIDIQRKCSHCEEEEKLQMKTEGGVNAGVQAPTRVHEVLSSKGQMMDGGTKSYMESRFGYDFGNVQVHNDSLAHRSSADINALAYTHGDHIVFGDGQYQPNSNAGKKLLAHELAHVVQQSNNIRRYGFDDCDNKAHRALIHRADLTAREMIKKVIKALSKSSLSSGVINTLQTYFGPAAKETALIRHYFEVIQSAFADNDYDYECESSCSTNVDAYVYWAGDVHLCSGMLNNYDDKGVARAIIHEFAHKYADLDDKEYCNTGNRCSNCSSKITKRNALNNADSFACTALDIYFVTI